MPRFKFVDRGFASMERILLLCAGAFANAGIVCLVSFVSVLAIRQCILPPTSHVRLPLHFLFDTCHDQLAHVCSYPTANATLRWPTATYDGEQYPVLVYGVSYEISIELHMLDTNQPKELFMVVVRVYDDNNQLSSTISRAHYIQPPPPPPFWSRVWRYSKVVGLWPLWLLGYLKEDRINSHSLRLAEQFFDSPDSPAKLLSVELQHRRIQVSSAELHLRASLNIFTHMVYHYPVWSSAVLFVCIASTLLMCSAIVWLQRLWAWFRRSSSHGHIGNNGDGVDKHAKEE